MASVWINGEWLPAETASLLISDLSIQRGYGIFDFFKLVNGKPVFLDDHLDRFYRSAEAMHLHPGIERPELVRVIDEMTARNQLADAGIKLTLTGGYSADGYSLARPNLIINSSHLQLERSMSSGTCSGSSGGARN
ncbi:MAG: aminotransferase class IV, partial [Flavihumibacter sp.]